MGKVVPTVVLPVHIWEGMPGGKSGMLLGGCSECSGQTFSDKYCTKDGGGVVASPSFHYGYWIRRAVERKKAKARAAAKLQPDDPYGSTLFPRKAGSFQVYVQGFRHARDVLDEWQGQKEHIPSELDQAFQYELRASSWITSSETRTGDWITG